MGFVAEEPVERAEYREGTRGSTKLLLFIANLVSVRTGWFSEGE